MKTKELSLNNNLSVFEQIKQIDKNGNEYWTARQLAKVLEYSEYRHFVPVVNRAKEACINSGQKLSDHFEDILEMIDLAKTAQRQVESVKLSRYACYLIVQNADPSKEVVALGQTYFAVQTRIREIQQMEEYNRLTSEEEKRLYLRNQLSLHNLNLASAAKNAGVIEPIDLLRKISRMYRKKGSITFLAGNVRRTCIWITPCKRSAARGINTCRNKNYEVVQLLRS